MMKAYKGKLPLPMIAGVVCALAFAALLYNETVSSLSSASILRLRTCASRRHEAGKAFPTELSCLHWLTVIPHQNV